ncbi:MAG: universal stress protein [Gammaproteobacteria bacterium]|jgi:nucleotide-binding universal stress UspA family protein
MKLLLVTDGSAGARLALDFLRAFPLHRGNELTIMSVIDKALYGTDDEESSLDEEQRDALHKTREMLREDAERLLEAEVERFGNPELKWSKRVRHGQPADEIVKTASELGVDLVVMGNHGLGGVKRFLLGSTSDEVMQYAPCSVLIVRPDQTGETDDAMRLDHPLHLLVAYDDSPHARRAAEFCASLPMEDDTQITALSVMPLVTSYRQDISQQLGWMWQERRKVIEKGLDALASEIDWPTPHVAVEVREGEDVSSAILDASDELDIDMIVIGDKGTGAIRKFLLGSVTRRIAHHAPCSVLVVREPARSRAS